ncbi:unnamed protein product [Effrenium voratum]|nr:unnamed protein product [Effrenium voratum]
MQPVGTLPPAPAFTVPMPGMPSMPAPGAGAPMLVPLPGLPTLPGSLPPMSAPLPGMMTMPPPGTMVSVAIDGLPFRYQLTEADLKETFERWGRVQLVQVSREGRDVGTVTFVDQVDAQDAQKQLTGQRCSFDGAEGTLVVAMGGPFQLDLPRAAPGAVPTLVAPPGNIPSAPKNGLDGKGPNGVRPNWCCKILVEAESLHPEFPTVLRIRGEADTNVDHIRTQTKCHVQLRGRGSGTLEPETNQELPEPMFLWLSSETVENGKASLEMTMDLLKSIYEGHQQWCEQNNILHPEFVKAKVIENPEVLPGVGAGGIAGQAGLYGPCKGAPIAMGKAPGPY